jgi:hypothetical protein
MSEQPSSNWIRNLVGAGNHVFSNRGTVTQHIVTSGTGTHAAQVIINGQNVISSNDGKPKRLRILLDDVEQGQTGGGGGIVIPPGQPVRITLKMDQCQSLTLEACEVDSIGDLKFQPGGKLTLNATSVKHIESVGGEIAQVHANGSTIKVNGPFRCTSLNANCSTVQGVTEEPLRRQQQQQQQQTSGVKRARRE